MKSDDRDIQLEIEADRLLRDAGATNHRCRIDLNEGIYTEKQLDDHRRREMSNYNQGIDLYSRAFIEEKDLILDDLDKLCKLAGFSDEQCLVWRLFHLGLSVSDIADVIGITRQGMSVRIMRCQKRLLRAMIDYPYFGWLDIYLSEVNRRDK